MNALLYAAVRCGDTERVAALIDAGADIDGRDRYNQTSLMNAARLGHIELVRSLVDRGAALNVTAKYGLTALMLAIIGYHEEAACILIRAGADPTVRGGKGAIGYFGKTALDLAMERNQGQVVALLQRCAAPRGE